MSQGTNRKRRKSDNKIEEVLKTAWLHAAVTDPAPPGMCECLECHRWRPEKPPTQANENDPCPHCGVGWLAF